MSAPRNIKLATVREAKARKQLIGATRPSPRDGGEVRHRQAPTSLPWPIEMVPVRHLKPAARNPRTHPKKQIEQLIRSIQHYGFTNPVLADEKLNIIAGHGRAKAAEIAGLTAVPVIIMSGLSEAEKRALALADNKIAERGGWFRADLAKEVSDLAPLLELEGLDLALTAFEPAEIDQLHLDLVDPEQDPGDQLPVLRVGHPVSRPGDLWRLGPHRLLCGDATNPRDMLTLLGRERAAMMMTDPPYNEKLENLMGRGTIRHREFAQASGEMSRQQFTAFLRAFMDLAAKYSANGAIAFVFIDWL